MPLPAIMKEQAAIINNFRLFIWRLVGLGSNLGLYRIKWSIHPKSLIAQAPEIALVPVVGQSVRCAPNSHAWIQFEALSAPLSRWLLPGRT